MSTDVTRDGLKGERPGRHATTGVNAGRPRSNPQQVVPDSAPVSYYGQPVLNRPVWEARDIAGYLFLGGLAGASSSVAAAAQLTGRPQLQAIAKVAAIGAGGLSLAALIHDLGRPARFLNMLRVFKPTSPMSVGSWLLAGYVPMAGAAAASELLDRAPRAGAAATAAAAVLGPAVASYTGALIADTAVPAWHDGHRHMPLIFAASGGSAAAGLGLALAPGDETGPLRALGMAAATTEVALTRSMRTAMGPQVAPAYEAPSARPLMRAAEWSTVAGTAAIALGGRSRLLARLGGAALVAGSACLRFGIFHAGLASADDPFATTEPQRRRAGGSSPMTADGGRAAARTP